VGKRPRGFHTPFADLKLPVPAPAQPPPAPTPPQPAKPAVDESLFEREMLGVDPLPADPRGQKGPLGASLEIGRAPRRSRGEDEAAAYAELADLVTGEGAFDIAATDEYIEGSAPGLDRRLVRRLRRGEYAVQAHLDLHGLTAAEAKLEVERFVDEAQRLGHRCVLLVHGRGLHSKDSVPVLKERLKVWLTRGRLARAVLAFATARPADGGAGAVYVLLRRA
jgi:DNA-nicking Smr family endonuclease